MLFSIVQPTTNKMSQTLIFLLAFGWSGLAMSTQSATPNTSNAKAPQLSPTNQYQLQVFKNCVMLKQRQLNSEEIAVYKKLKNYEQQMDELQAPLALMEQQLGQQTKRMKSMSDQIAQQVNLQGEPDPVLLETQAELSEDISAIVDSFQPDIDAVSKNGEAIANLADEFSELISKDNPSESYDQIRVIEPGDADTKDCNQGMFFQKTISVKKTTDLIEQQI
jgi:hypothetical protein